MQVAAAASPPPQAAIRVNQLGYLPDAPKVAVFCALQKMELRTFAVTDGSGKTLIERAATPAKPFGPCVTNYRLDFSSLIETGVYRVVAGGVSSPIVRVRENAYAGAADTLLYYMREQRSGFNPIFHTVVHTHDGIVVDDAALAGKFVPVTGGWADASDYLQYVMTSANATFVMLQAYRDHPRSFADRFDSRGLLGSNGVPDVLDEARHGLEWLVRMFPSDSEMYNQLGDDRDHTYWDLPTSDSSDYGWGKGKERPVYPCTGKPQGLFKYKNRSNGLASTAGKYASAFALAALVYNGKDPAFAAKLRRKALSAYAIGKRYPGVCQGAPGRAPYYYEEDNWVDDMELAGRGAIRPDPPSILPARCRRLRFAGTGDPMDGCGYSEALSMVSLAQQRSLRNLAQREYRGSQDRRWLLQEGFGCGNSSRRQRISDRGSVYLVLEQSDDFVRHSGVFVPPDDGRQSVPAIRTGRH